MNHHYNPDWFSDDALITNFVARQNEFLFLRDELVQAPLQGNAQHYLLVGVRGAGKTTLLKRLAVAIRQDPCLSNHLIALSFPEELYQVKNLADFWWAACDALCDELDRGKQFSLLNKLNDAIEQSQAAEKIDNPTSDSGFNVLLNFCNQLGRRPVLLVDNLDMIFERIDKSGRKLKDPNSPAYWALREALSTASSPVVIGGSVRLSEAFTSYDRAFYDFFIPKRLGKLSLQEVLEVLERLAELQGTPDLKPRLRARPGRIEALYELTGGNPRALSLIFDLLRNGPNSRAVEDFERLMDVTTPYYKARIEDLSEQAQVIMHSLAVYPGGDSLRFGHTAAEIGAYARLPTTTVSAQLTSLENEGLVEKSSNHGRAQYRIAEQLFRLWLQMRATRRIRQNVIGLTRFFEAMYELDELKVNFSQNTGASALADAKFAFAVAGTKYATLEQRDELEAFGTSRLQKYLSDNGGDIDEYLPASDAKDIPVATDKEDVRQIEKAFTADAILKCSVADLEKSFHRAVDENSQDYPLWMALGNRFYHEHGKYEKSEAAYRRAAEIRPKDVTARINLAMLLCNKLGDIQKSEKIYRCLVSEAPADPRVWYHLGNLLYHKSKRFEEARESYEQAVQLKPNYAKAWLKLGSLLEKSKKEDEAEAAFRKAVEFGPNYERNWLALANFLVSRESESDEASNAFAKAIEIRPDSKEAWLGLGKLLSKKKESFAAAEAAFNKAISIDPHDKNVWMNYAFLLSDHQEKMREAEKVYRKVIELSPGDMWPWLMMGSLIAKDNARLLEAEEAYRRAIELAADNSYWGWLRLGILLATQKSRFDEAESALRKALELRSDDTLASIQLIAMLVKEPERKADAVSIFEDLVSANKSNEKLRGQWCSFLAHEVQLMEKADGAFQEAIADFPNSSQLKMDYASFLIAKKNNLTAAESIYREIVDFDENNFNAWIELGKILKKDAQRVDEAAVAFQHAARYEITDPSALVEIATFELEYKALNLAEPMLRRAIEIDHGSIYAWGALGILLSDQKRFDEAENALRSAINCDPQAAAWVWEILGIVLGHEMERYDEAESALKKSIELDPTVRRTHAHLGNLYKLMDRNDDALEAFNNAVGSAVLPLSAGTAESEWYTECCVLRITKAVGQGNVEALKATLTDLVRNIDDPAPALVGDVFVENLLVGSLSDKKSAVMILQAMRDSNYDRYAKPLLLALEAVIANKEALISEIEPEMQDATMRMYQRLMKGLR